MKIETGKTDALIGRFISASFVATVLALALVACGPGSGTPAGGGGGSPPKLTAQPIGGPGGAGGGGGGGTGVGGGSLIGGTIQKTLALTGTVSLFAGSASGVAGNTNATGTAALFFNPDGVTTDGTNLYVADASNNQIRKIVIATGVVSLLAGSTTGALGLTNGAGSAALFNNPNAITTDGINLYVTDYVNHGIRKIVIATGVVSLLAGSTTGAPGLNNATGTAATFNNPSGITTDGTNLYVADSGNNEIRKIVIATGAVSLLAGSTTGAPGLNNATGTAATFANPHHITSDSMNLYVTEVAGNDVRQIIIATGAVTLLAGSPAGTAGSTNATGTAAMFSNPTGITADGTSLYVGDWGNNEIRKIQ